MRRIPTPPAKDTREISSGPGIVRADVHTEEQDPRRHARLSDRPLTRQQAEERSDAPEEMSDSLSAPQSSQHCTCGEYDYPNPVSGTFSTVRPLPPETLHGVLDLFEDFMGYSFDAARVIRQIGYHRDQLPLSLAPLLVVELSKRVHPARRVEFLREARRMLHGRAPFAPFGRASA